MPKFVQVHLPICVNTAGNWRLKEGREKTAPWGVLGNQFKISDDSKKSPGYP